MTKLSYQEARLLIQDGDVVFIHGSWRRPIQALIMWFTNSKFSHVCLAFKVTTGGVERLMCVEAQGKTKRRILNLSFYDDKDMTILAAPRDWAEIQGKALERVGKAKYSFLAAAYIGVRELVHRTLDIKLPSLDLPHEICSEFIAKVVGLPDTDVSPQVLYEDLLSYTVERKK